MSDTASQTEVKKMSIGEIIRLFPIGSVVESKKSPGRRGTVTGVNASRADFPLLISWQVWHSVEDITVVQQDGA